MSNLRTILVPVDFSDGSLAAVTYARTLADAFGSQLHILHVAAAPDSPRWAAEFFGSPLGPIQEQNRIAALDRLATLIVAQRLDPFRTTGLVRLGSAEDVIASYADEIHADLIVMGLHGDHLTPRAPIGLVIERVLGTVHCPVLTVPDEPRPAVTIDDPSVWQAPAVC